jgi:hypothetical protein
MVAEDYHPSVDVDEDPYRSYTTLATVIPLVVGTVITLVIVISVVGLVYQHRRHRAAVNRVRQMVRERSALQPASENAEDDLPPGFSDGENDTSGTQHIYEMNIVVKTVIH